MINFFCHIWNKKKLGKPELNTQSNKLCFIELISIFTFIPSCRSCRLYNPNSHRCCYNITKLLVNGSLKPTENGEVVPFSLLVKPLHPKISMHILFAVLYTLSKVLIEESLFNNQQLVQLVIISFILVTLVSDSGAIF